jgi:hypothetical protein
MKKYKVCLGSAYNSELLLNYVIILTTLSGPYLHLPKR